MLTELSALLDLLKAKGVSHYEGPGMADQENGHKRMVCIDFGPSPAAAPSAPSTDEKDDEQGDSDTCRCGHALSEHTNGLCLHACDVEQCAPVED